MGSSLYFRCVRVGGDDHAAGGDLIADLLGGQMRLALGDALHLGRDRAEPGVFELGDGGEIAGIDNPTGRAVGLLELAALLVRPA
jgi:hypothetical protein